MEQSAAPGQIIVLNGAPRAGKSSITTVIMETFGGPWMNLGNDTLVRRISTTYQPGQGLRPGEPSHPAAQYVANFYAAMYESIAAHSRLGINVVSDTGHHDSYGRGILLDCARRLRGLPAMFVGVRCDIDEIMRRRDNSPPGHYARSSPDDPVPEPVRRWQEMVHVPGIYDIEVDTTTASPDDCAGAIHARWEDGAPLTAFAQLAALEA
jgi:chloramphenicol 3-O phosphotransferase